MALTAPGSGVVGTPTFLFSDIEGSTRLLQQLGTAYAGVLDEHRRLIIMAVEGGGGSVFGTEGDALFCAFPTPLAAVTAAAEAQRALAASTTPAGEPIRVRMGIHTGEAMFTGDDYVGLALHQVARLMSAGHGGQVLVSEATQRLIGRPPAGLELRDLGARRLKDLTAAEHIYQLVGEGLAERFPPLRTLDKQANNLPVQLTSFVGRAELAVAREALAETRLLTLSGPGGTGKTRLALQLAGEVSDEFEDGVWFIALDAVTDEQLVPSVIASSIGLNVGGTKPPLDAVIEHLRDKQLLLVLDNFEQIVDAATVVSALVRDAPRIKVIVTTRVVLRVSGEREFPVPPLGLPADPQARPSAAQAATYEAVQLFVQRALAVRPAFMLDDENAAMVVEICRRLDGLPLAIELAAARTRSLPVAAIHARLDQHLALLTGGGRDLPGRQQTLRGAIDWSYDLLEQPDRHLFERFSIHAGGAFLAQADAVCGPAVELGEDVLDGLSSLADKSLVKPDLDAEIDPRFVMLVTIRAYAHERLSGSDEYQPLARRHARAYLGLAEQHSGDLIGRGSREAADRLARDHDNLRAALDWAVREGEVEVALRFIIALWRFWQTRGDLDEARRRIDAVLALPGVADQPDEMLARAYGAAGGVTYWQGDVRATHGHYGRALEAARRTGDKRRIAVALYDYGFAAVDQDRPSNEVYLAGQPYWEESLALYRELGDEKGQADASWGLSTTFAALGQQEEAIRYAKDALAVFRRLDDPFRIGWGVFMLASLAAGEHDLDGLEQNLRESMAIFAGARDQAGVLLNLAGFAWLAELRGDMERHHRLAGAAAAMRAQTGYGLIDTPVEFADFSIPDKPTDDPEAVRQWEAGAQMSADEAVAYALETPALSHE
ncbi:hypothetical protein BH24CHL5_BH24CHL5_05300 [soil metagenome]